MKSDINKYGQFFTEKEMCKWVLSITNGIKKINGSVLEPSFGIGSFIDELGKYEDISIDGVEIDKKYFDSYKNDKASLYNGDFLDFDISKRYDFIVGNPPYIELCYSFYDKDKRESIKNEYSGVSNGRVNLVHIFMKKSMSMINNDGVISYLLPSSILTSPTYKSIRKEIFENFNIEYLREDVNFTNVSIKVCLLILRKKENTGKYFYIDGENYFIMENYDIFKNSKSIKEFGFNVSIGEVVWNQKKELLTDDSNENTLVYSGNIKYDGLDFISKNRGRKQYIIGQNVKYRDCIIFTRVVSKSIKFHFIRDNKNYIFENHVLVLTNKDISLLEKFYDSLKSGIYNDLLHSFFNSSNLTKSELLSLPFYT